MILKAVEIIALFRTTYRRLLLAIHNAFISHFSVVLCGFTEYHSYHYHGIDVGVGVMVIRLLFVSTIRTIDIDFLYRWQIFK